MKKETFKTVVKQVNHSNQHTSQKTEVVPKDKNKWPYEYLDHKYSRGKQPKS